jgi:hypothetical protein
MEEEDMYKWEVKFSISPSFMILETGSEYHFKVEGEFTTHVVVQYETAEINERLDGRRSDDEYAEQTIAYNHQLAIKELMIQRMIYRKLAEPIEVVMIGKPKLLNRKELESGGLPIEHPLRVSWLIPSNILDNTDYLKESLEFWDSGLNYDVENLEKDIFRISEWLILAEKQNDHIKSFILTWIAFNGLYNLYSSIVIPEIKQRQPNHELKDNEMFEHTIDKLIGDIEARKIINDNLYVFDLLQSLDIHSKSGITNYSEDLERLRNSEVPNNIEIIKYATKCIYGIRKTVFHEAPNMENIDENCKQSKKLLSITVVPIVRSSEWLK